MADLAHGSVEVEGEGGAFELTDYQRRVLLLPHDVNVALLGGRAGGKSYALAALLLRHASKWGARSRTLFIRRSYAGLRDFEGLALRLFPAAFPGARWNQQEHVWRLPNGALVEFGFLDSESDFQRYQGRQWQLICIDEVTQFPDLALVDMLRSCLRGPADVPTRMVVAGNPGGPGHAAVAARWALNGTPAWIPFRDTHGNEWIRAPSTLADNRFLDQTQYAADLRASVGADAELAAAWLDGRWDIARGSYFAGALSEAVRIAAWDRLPRSVAHWSWDGRRLNSDWRIFLSLDWGSAAPAVCLLMAESNGEPAPDGRTYPKGSLIAVDEVATAREGNPAQGLGLSVPETAERILAMCRRWRAAPVGLADDSLFAKHGSAAGSLAAEFRSAGVRLSPARKGSRVAGWERLKRMLSNAGAPDVPGMYISELCKYTWATLPTLARDARNPEDVDSSGADHAADALRYALGRDDTGAGAVKIGWVH